MKEIGGYFELELKPYHNFPQDRGVFLNSGRSALGYILHSLFPVTKLWIPYLTCDVVLEPINRLDIQYVFYEVNERLELAENIELKPNEYLLYNNYFGIKTSYVENLFIKYGNQLIVDNAQALYAKHIDGTNSLYSPRKFVGIPDGGIAYTNKKSILELKQDLSYDRCSHLMKRIDCSASFGYDDFKKNSLCLKNQTPLQMSNLTKKMIDGIDFRFVFNQRRKNFDYLHSILKKSNLLKFEIKENDCPLVYPYISKKIGLREKLIHNNVFVATYWPNVFEWCNTSALEYNLAKNIVSLPIDQRYSTDDIFEIAKIIEK
ncbi:hypothetical protein LJC11_03475 [Bacteroidales bacterium OttesenSCG-928-I21]|nr:hypothetical protein [Bacteroidales bacterium OttesenSCG-928-I21]